MNLVQLHNIKDHLIQNSQQEMDNFSWGLKDCLIFFLIFFSYEKSLELQIGATTLQKKTS